MQSHYGDVVLITGASSGIGKALAEGLAEEGLKVYGTSRHVKGKETVVSENETGGFFKLIRLDVCDDESAKAAVEYVAKKEGQINILINNAGFGVAGPIEETTSKEAISQLDTNFFGMHRMILNTLPIMRKQNKGLIVNIGSVAGLISIPYQAMYCASKYAVEALSEALRMEVKDFGIKVTVVEPGDTKTGFPLNRQYSEESKESAYKNSQKSVEKMMEDELNGPGPETVVKVVKG